MPKFIAPKPLQTGILKYKFRTFVTKFVASNNRKYKTQTLSEAVYHLSFERAMAGLKYGRIIGFTLVVYVLLMFVFVARTTGVIQIGYPAPWLRVSDGDPQILMNGLFVDTLLWLCVSLIISLVIHIVKR